jgi:lipopolysaccharide transport system permease protein
VAASQGQPVALSVPLPRRAASSLEELVIEPGRTERAYWRDIWRYRELFYFLAWRDVLVRYKQTEIGIAWAVLRPLITTVVLTVVFSRVAGLQAPGNAPYALMVFAGMLPWQFFATALSEASGSLIGNAHLISKVYFPRLIVPAGAVITSFVDFAIMLGMIAMLMAWYGYLPDWRVLTLPLFVALGFGVAFGAGLWLCALNVTYRDFRYVVPFIVQFGLYISPVGFATESVPPEWRLAYSLNPMVGVIDGFRWALLRGAPPLWWPGLAASALVTIIICVFGGRYFRRRERQFADVI